MSDSIETLLVRNLHEVFGERDPARRTIAIEAIFDRDCLFSDPPHQQQASIRRLVAAVKIHCEFLAPDRWQVERKRYSFGHGGCGAPLIRDAIRLDTDLLPESLILRHSRYTILMPRA
jgi:hypothetical protein